MSGTRADARKRRSEQLPALSEPQWRGEPMCCETHGRVLRALRAVYADADLMEAQALADALEAERLL